MLLKESNIGFDHIFVYYTQINYVIINIIENPYFHYLQVHA